MRKKTRTLPPGNNLAMLRNCRPSSFKKKLGKQHGQALLALLAILAIVFSVAFYTFISPTGSTIERDAITADALAQAKAALIGYAASDNNRPGSLPCPDLLTNIVGNTPNDGTTDFYAGSECPGYVASSNVYLGRLPWKTLGLPDLRDGNGERLWYVVSRDFARNPTCMTPSVPGCPLNSDTLGQLTVTGVAPAGNVIAIIFSAGTSLGTQTRNVAGENTAANYLEGENADGINSTFTTQVSSTTFNDKLLAITGGALMPVVERRVAREMIAILQQYKAATATSTLATLRPTIGVYPWADRSTGDSSTWNHNRFPCDDALPVNWNTAVPSSSPLTNTPSLPLWLTNSCTNPVTGWTSVIYYAVAQNKLENNSSCTNCTDPVLTVTNASNRTADLCPTGGTTCNTTVVTSGSADLLLITPGAATASPRGNWPTATFLAITGYFEDAENSGNNNDIYIVPASTAYDRDHIYVVR